jgi:hypothetical protein
MIVSPPGISTGEPRRPASSQAAAIEPIIMPPVASADSVRLRIARQTAGGQPISTAGSD